MNIKKLSFLKKITKQIQLISCMHNAHKILLTLSSWEISIYLPLSTISLDITYKVKLRSKLLVIYNQNKNT